MRISRRTFSQFAAAVALLNPPARSIHAATPNEGSDAGSFESAPERLDAMMNRLPASLLDGRFQFSWSDFERHLQGTPELPSDQLDRELPSGFAWDVPYGANFMMPNLGFEPPHMRQVATVGQYARGRVVEIDTTAIDLPATWEDAGYELREDGFGDYWYRPSDENSSLLSAVQQPSGDLDHLVILDDRLVVSAPTSDLLAELVAHHREPSAGLATVTESLAQSLPATASSAWGMDGEFFGREESFFSYPEDVAALEAVGPMPAVKMFATGYTPGAFSSEAYVPGALAYMALQSSDADQADQMAEVLEWRLNHFTSFGARTMGVPLAEVFAGVKITTPTSDAVLLTVEGEAVQQSQFAKMIAGSDISLFAFISED